MADRKKLKKLSGIFRTPVSDKEMQALLDDFLTPAEIDTLYERWKLVCLLLEGKTQPRESVTPAS